MHHIKLTFWSSHESLPPPETNWKIAAVNEAVQEPNYLSSRVCSWFLGMGEILRDGEKIEAAIIA